MKVMKQWVDPVKNKPAKDSTLDIRGSFEDFTNIMRKIITKREEETKPSSSSVRVPGVS